MDHQKWIKLNSTSGWETFNTDGLSLAHRCKKRHLENGNACDHSMENILGATAVQKANSTSRLNSKLEIRSIPPASDLTKDLSDGVILIHLLEILANESLGKYAVRPLMYVQKAENVNKVLDYIRHRGIPLHNIGAEDIVDGNQRLTLGLLWTLIARFTVNNISEEGMSAKEGLLLWCQRKTACYDSVDVRDFSSSWNDGLAFCALLDIHRPDLIDYESLDKSDHKGNMALAFQLASEEIGIPALLDVEDVCDVHRPDEKSLMTYIAYWFHAFSHLDRIENAGRRVEKFVEHMQGAWDMQHSYEQRMEKLLALIRQIRDEWSNATFKGTYPDAKMHASGLAQYKRSSKREWVSEKAELVQLLGNIKTKLATYRLKDYDPPANLTLAVLEKEWNALLVAEKQRSMLINEKIRDIKEYLRRTYADRANEFSLVLSTVHLEISALGGSLERQLDHVRTLNKNLLMVDKELAKIKRLSTDCEEANIEENDYTVYAYDELEYEFGLAKNSTAKKLGFLENQIVARNMTNLTPIQLEEFESVFRYFDRDASNTLQEIEFSAALASLGLVYDETDMHDTFKRVSKGSTSVTFEQFIRFMVEVTEDQNTSEQVFSSFREVADGKPYVTEVDLRHSLIPETMVDELMKTMPLHQGPLHDEDEDLQGYDYVRYMENMTGTKVVNGNGH